MKKVILTLAILALLGADSQACGRQPVRNAIRAVFSRPASEQPTAAPVRQVVAAPLRVVGEVLSAGGNIVGGWGTAVRGGQCSNGVCR